MTEEFEKTKNSIITQLPEIPKHITEEWLVSALNDSDIFGIWGFAFSDLTNNTFGNISEETLRRVNISTYTKLPVNHPFNLDFNLQIDYDIKNLHNQGINGSLVNIAVIDQAFLPIHEEVKSCLKEYKDNGCNYDSSGFHGLTVISNLAGKNLGVAPNSNIYFYALSNESQVSDGINFLKDIYKKNLQGANIRIISISSSLHRNSEEFENIKYLLEQQGCYVIDARAYGSMFTSINQRNINGIPHYYFSQWQCDEAHKEIRKAICVPFTGLAPLYGTIDQYQMGGDCSYSWTIPRVSGILALCLQIKPDLTLEEAVHLAQDTKIVTEDGISIINPKGMIEKLSLDLNESRSR